MDARQRKRAQLVVCWWRVIRDCRRRNAPVVEAGSVRTCNREDGIRQRKRCPDDWRQVSNLIPAMEEGVFIRLAGGSSDPMRSRARGDERCVCCEAGEGHIHLANVEGATAVVMQHGYQRGEYFEGCEQALIGKSRVVPGSSDSGHTRWKFSESCPVLGRNKPRTSSELKPSRW